MLENMKGYDCNQLQVESCGHRADTISLHRILHNLLIGGVNSEKKQFIYNEIATLAIPILSKFDARCLSNLIYSFGLAEFIPKGRGWKDNL